jgi:2-amino-4-hydroxy-6-hydroxymethyldihydropteridine diphosphokinase
VTRAFVGLGGNLGNRQSSLRRAVALLGARPGIAVVLVSSLRETEPVGLVDQPRFLNGVAMVETTLEPDELLAELLLVEQALGRTRDGRRFGPRTIDLDLLLYGDRTVDQPGLTVPHQRLHERVFALEPLAELDPALLIPGRGTVSELLAGLHSTA